MNKFIEPSIGEQLYRRTSQLSDAEDQVEVLRYALNESQSKMRKWKAKYYKCCAELIEEMARTTAARRQGQ